jgi:DNA-binding transcriptional LysR family regulator
MNLKLFDAFVAVARRGGFHAAARHLDTTQPAVSMRVRELERALGHRLFERVRRTVFLTTKGQELLPLAERLLADYGEIAQQVGDKSAAAETVRVGVSELIAVTWLSDLTAEIARRFPHVTLHFDIDLVYSLTGKLRDRELDLLLCMGPMVDAGLRNVSLGTVPLDWFANARLGLRRGRLGPGDLARFPLISLSPHSSLHTMALDWFRAGNLAAKRVNFCNSMNTVSLLVRAGQGLSILPAEYYTIYEETGEMRAVDVVPKLPSIEYVAAYYDQEAASPLVGAIAGIAAEVSLFRLPARRRAAAMRERAIFAEWGLTKGVWRARVARP